MYFGILTLVTALAISAVAIYYSVAGLAAIFAAAVIPIIIMGSVLEISKLVTAVWLHRHWHQATWWLKSYLGTAVLVLMFITSMGIFGFLSNAHVQQTAQSDNATAQLERIEGEIARQQAIISRAERKIENVQTSGVGADSNIQSQIDREQERIDRAYERAKPAIEEQRDIIARHEDRIIAQIADVDEELKRVDDAIANGDIATAQTIIGVQADGIYGPNTQQAVQNFRDRKAQEKTALEQRLAEVDDDPRVKAAREEIDRIRSRLEQEVAQSNELINRLRSQLGQSTGEDIEAVISNQNSLITEATETIDNLTQEKFEIQAKFRQLEAEVGPIKYIAEFVYGEDADKNLLEEAVRWVIVIIIFVFDPLAVLLLIASQYTFRWEGRDILGGDHNLPDDTPPPAETPLPKNAANEDYGLTAEEAAQPYVQTEPQSSLAPDSNLQGPEKKDTELLDESAKRSRQALIDEQDQSVHWHEAKKLWKEANPEETLKEQKQKYLAGEIDRLPWEDYLTENSEAVQKKRSYIMKKDNQQIRRNRE